MANGVELATAYVSIIPEIKGMNKAARRAAAGIPADIQKEMSGPMGAVGETEGSKLGQRVSSGAGKVLKGGMFAVGALGATALAKGFGRLKGLDAAEGKLTGLGHSAKSVDSIMANALESVKGTSFGMEEAATTAAGSVAAGIKPGKDLTANLKLVADAATIAGTDMGSMGAIFNKVASSNKIQGDVIAQLSDQGIPIIQFLSKELGKSAEETMELASAGKVNFKTFQNAMEEGLGGAAASSGKTFTGALKNTGAALGRLGANALQGVFPQLKEGFGTATSLIDRMGPAAEQMGAKLGKGVAAGAKAVGGFVADFKEGEGAAGRFRGALSRVRDILGTGITAVMDKLGPHLKSFAGNMKDLAPQARALADSVGTFLVDAFAAAKPYLMALAGILGGAFVLALKVLPPLLSGLMSALSGVLGVLRPLLPVLAAVAAAYLTYRAALVAVSTYQKIAKGVMIAYNAVVRAGQAVMAAKQAVTYSMAAAQRFYTATVMGGTGAVKAKTVAEKIGMAVGKAQVAVTKAMAFAQRLFNAAMRANPIGLIITGITLLVGAFILLYKKNDTARRIMDRAWKAIKGAILGTVSWFRDTAWPWMRDTFNAISSKAGWLWGKIKGFFQRIWDFVKRVAGWIKNVGWAWIRNAFQWIADKAKWLWEQVKRSFNWWLGKAKDVSGWIKRQMVDRIRSAFNAISDKAGWLWDKINSAFGKIKDGARAVKDAFKRARDGIRDIWSKLYGHIQAPIKKALRWLNNNLIGKLNTLLRKIPGVSFQIDTINIPRGWDTGGYTGPGAKYAPAGIVHKDEFVLKKEATNKLRKRVGLSGLNYMNETGELPGFADGGIVALGKRLQRLGYHVSEHPAFGGVVPGAHSPNGYHYKAGALDVNADPWNSRFNRETPALDKLNAMLRGEGWNTIWRAANHWDHLHVDVGNGQGSGGGGLGFLKRFLPQWAQDLADGPAKFIRSKVSGFMDKMPGGDRFGLAGKILPGLVGKAAKGLGSKVADAFDLSKLIDKFTPGWLSGGDKGGGGSEATRAAVRSVASRYGWGTGAQWSAIDWLVGKESSWDPGAANPTSSARGLFQKMTSIHGPVEGTAAGQAEWGLKYIKQRYGSPSAAQAFWRRNNWYADGGLVKALMKAPVFDRGGTLAPGYNIVHNKLGRPEPLRRADERLPEQGNVYVQNPWTGEYLLARTRDEIEDHEDFKESVRRMGP